MFKKIKDFFSSKKTVPTIDYMNFIYEKICISFNNEIQELEKLYQQIINYEETRKVLPTKNLNNSKESLKSKYEILLKETVLSKDEVNKVKKELENYSKKLNINLNLKEVSIEEKYYNIDKITKQIDNKPKKQVNKNIDYGLSL